MAYRLLAFAAVSGRVAFVLLSGGQPFHWEISAKAGKSAALAYRYAVKRITDFAPDAVVVEDVRSTRHKQRRAKEIIVAIAEAAADQHVLDLQVERVQRYQTKYEEAEALAERFPDLAPWKPTKRRFFDNEPRNTVLFEALALAQAFLEPEADSSS